MQTTTHYTALNPEELDRLALNVAVIEALNYTDGHHEGPAAPEVVDLLDPVCPNCGEAASLALWADDGEDDTADHAACNDCGWDADDEPIPGYTVHPFADECLWSANDEPLRVDTLEQARSLTVDERDDLAGVRHIDPDFIAGFWAAVYNVADELEALISPTGALITGDQARSIYGRIDQSGQWPA